MRKTSLTLNVFLLILLTNLTDSISDLLLKKGLNDINITSIGFHNALPFLAQCAGSYLVWLGLLAYLLTFFTWIRVLSKTELSTAFPVASTGYIITPLLAMIFLKEGITLPHWGGICMIAAGVYCISRSKEKAQVDG